MKYSDLKIISDTSMFPGGYKIFHWYSNNGYDFQIIELSEDKERELLSLEVLCKEPDSHRKSVHSMMVSTLAIQEIHLDILMEAYVIQSHKELKNELERD